MAHTKRVGVYELSVRRIGAVCEAATVTGPADAHVVISSLTADKAVEHFVVVFLDARNHVSGAQTVSVGSLNSSIVHPREVFRLAIEHGAASIILGHNHPSGDTTPSSDDIQLTTRLAKAGELLGIAVMDHVIIGSEGYLSFKERGIM